jgi:tetratricopeptide (TPR) repeat protein
MCRSQSKVVAHPAGSGTPMRQNGWVAFGILGMSLSMHVLVMDGQQANARKHAAASTDTIQSIESSIRDHQYDHALEVTSAALRIMPSDSRLWTLEGIVYSLKGSDEQALSAFGNALKLSPEYPAAMRGEVQLYYKSGDKRAIPLLEEILKTDPKDATAHEMLAVLQGRLGDCEAADRQFSMMIAAINTHPESLEAYGNCLVQTGQAEKAVAIFQQLVELLPQVVYPRYDLAVVMVESKQYEAAIKVLDPLIAADSSDPDVLSLASDAYEGIGDTPKAVALLRQAIVLSPADTDYYTSFAALCLNHESYQVGIDMIHAGMQRIPDDPSLYLSLGLLYAQLADYDEAEAAFRTAGRLDSRQSVSSYALDITEIQKNHSEETIANLRSQLKAHPNSALLHYLFAKLVVSAGNDSDTKLSAEALQSALLAVKLKPDMTEARDLLAIIYTDSNQFALAMEQCRLALKSNPDDQTAIYHLILALRHSKQPEDRAEAAALVKRLGELQKIGRQNETNRKRFKLVEQEPAPKPE